MPAPRRRAAGLAWIGRKTSFSCLSNLSESTIAHELGHNFNLRPRGLRERAGSRSHLPLAQRARSAPGDTIRATAGSLVPPDWADLMSYCHPEWISDYYFTNSLRYRLRGRGRAIPGPGALDGGRSSCRAVSTRTGFRLWSLPS